MRELMSGAEDVLGREARRRLGVVFSPEFYTLGSYLRMFGRAGEVCGDGRYTWSQFYSGQSVDPE